MKYEIEIPNLPEGVRPVGYGLKSKEFALCSDERGNLAVFCAHRPLPHLIRVIPTDGYEFVGRESDFLVTVRLPIQNFAFVFQILRSGWWRSR